MTAPMGRFNPIMNARPNRLRDLLRMTGQEPNVEELDKAPPLVLPSVDKTLEGTVIPDDRRSRLRDVLRSVAGGLSGISPYERGMGGFFRDLGRGYAQTSDTQQAIAQDREDRGLEREDRAQTQADRIRRQLREDADDLLDRRNVESQITDREADNSRQRAPTPIVPWWEREGYPTETEGVAGQRRRYPERFDGRAPSAEDRKPQPGSPEHRQAWVARRYEEYMKPTDNQYPKREDALASATKDYDALFPAGRGASFGDVRGGGSTAVGQPSTATAPPAMTPADQERAARDPAFAAFLKRKGLLL